MKLKSWLQVGLLLMVLTFMGCNLFNPSGEGDPGDTNLNLQGEEFFRRGQYAKAMEAYEKAIANDSTNSMAYYGYAKAAVALYKLDKLGVLEDVEATAKEPSEFAFLKHDDAELTLRLQAAAKVRLVLGLLTNRDTLTRWYKYLNDSSAADPDADNYDSLYAARRLFITDYLVKADQDSVGYRKQSAFPLTDFRMSYTSIILDYTAFDLLYTITRLYDLDQNDTIDSRDALMKNLQFGSSGGFSIDSLSKIQGDLENDTATTQNLNSLIASMSSGLVGTSQLAGLIGLGAESDSSDTNSTSAQTSGNMDSVIASLGDAVLFYQFGDKLDNDGDGCIDEELMDEKDNDLDGYVDEDARVIPDTKPDNVDNNLDGLKDPFNPPLLLGTDTANLEAVVGDTVPSRRYVLKFVHNYLLANPADDDPEPSLADFIKIKKNSGEEQLAFRLALQKDSLLTKRNLNGRLPDSLATKLQNAKTQIGGCWRNLKTVSE